MNLFVHIVSSWTDRPDYEATSMAVALASFVDAPNWAVARQVLQHHPELLGDLAESMLARAAEAADPGSPRRQRLLDHLGVLWRCRRVGTAAAFASLPGGSDDGSSSSSDARALVATIHQFVFAPTAVVARRILDEHPELLSDRAEFILTNAARSIQPEAQVYMRNGLELLRRCRQVGADAAFATVRPR